MVIAGLATLGSSKVPTRTKIRCGRASDSLNMGVPQSGQNRRCIRLPLSAKLEKSLVFPATLNVAVRKQAPTVPLPAPRYWQSRHQQTRVVIGGSLLSQRTAPQRHPPVTVIARSRLDRGICSSAHRTLAIDLPTSKVSVDGGAGEALASGGASQPPGYAALPTLKVNSRGKTLEPDTTSSPADTGSVKRRGPALPGLTYSTPFRSSIRG